MKYFCSLLFLIIGFTGQVSAQETLFDLMARSTPIPEGFETIFDLDVAKYYQLSGDYSKEPKRSEFKKTEWYRTKLAQLKVIRDSMLKKQYNVHLITRFNDNNYDDKRNGFDIVLGSNAETADAPANAPKTVYGYLFKALPARQEHLAGHPEGVYIEKLFLSMSARQAREIESSREYTDVYFFFTPTVREKTTFNYMNVDGKWRKAYADNIRADKVRVVVANTSSGVIYYDKTFEVPEGVSSQK